MTFIYRLLIAIGNACHRAAGIDKSAGFKPGGVVIEDIPAYIASGK